MRRLMLYDRLGNPLGELPEADVFEAVLREEINGEHSLTITTTRVLDKGIRLLYEDGRNKWREFVVAGVDAEHASGNRAIGTYYCVWSVQQDLQGVTVSVMPGVQSPASAGIALQTLLSTTDRWTRGTVTQMTTGGASMYDRSAWEALSVLVDVWGGEIDTTITIGTQSGVVGRAVDLYAAQGEQTAMRRFDFGADLMSVKRTLADDPLFCRISPRGKGEQTDAGGYGRKITIESVNDGKDWLEYAPMVDAAKLPSGSGYEYPTLIVENSDCETPSDLKAWGESVLAQYCTPKVTYEIDVLQAGAEGVDVTGVSLGDAVQVVDRKFGGDGIRVQGRVRSITTDLLNERDITIVIGDGEQSVSSRFASVDKSLATVSNDLTVMSTADYIDNLLDRINTEINATGGYTYIVPGNGILTFDVAVADPLNPVEASQVVEVKGGSIRIANSRTAQGAWEWKSVFTSGHITADLITAVQLTAGYIGSVDSGNYWDLDGGQLTIGARSKYGSTTSIYYRALTKVGAIATTNADLYNRIVGIASSADERYVLGLITRTLNDAQTSEFSHILVAPAPYAGSSYHSTIACNGNLNIYGRYLDTSSGALKLTDGATITNDIYIGQSAPHAELSARSTGEARIGGSYITLIPSSSNSVAVQFSNNTYAKYAFTSSQLSVGYSTNLTANLMVYGSSTVSGTKSRLVETDHYSDRLLYAYETPEPYFGDIGSGTIGDDGLCYVEIDDIFSETARADMAYQVFLQKCGQGDLWVESKSSTHFVVRGTPGLAFDWELKAKQTGFEHLRLEDNQLSATTDNEREYGIDTDEAYSDELNYIDAIERVIYEAA